ncbi:MAG: hypothetical protein ACTHNH_09930, partial [Mesorhizobium sp.]
MKQNQSDIRVFPVWSDKLVNASGQVVFFWYCQPIGRMKGMAQTRTEALHRNAEGLDTRSPQEIL